MKDEIKKQKGFIQLPLLIGIVVSIIIAAMIIGYRKNSNPELSTIIKPSVTPTKFSTTRTTTESSVITTSLSTTTITIPAETTIAEPPVITTVNKETYVYHDYYPIILSLSDDKGNITKSSNYNKYNGPYTSIKTKTPLKIGDEIYLKIEASDPQNKQILYGWQLVYKEAPANIKWTTNNDFRYQITAEDLKGAGELFRIAVYIKSEKEYLRFSGLFDDSIFLDYTLLP